MTQRMQPKGIPSAPTGSVASRAFALRNAGGNQIERRAPCEGGDS
jgi:hypothetical protein